MFNIFKCSKRGQTSFISSNEKINGQIIMFTHEKWIAIEILLNRRGVSKYISGYLFIYLKF